MIMVSKFGKEKSYSRGAVGDHTDRMLCPALYCKIIVFGIQYV